ncbi:hypothetical protein [Chitinophaga sp. LS1]|uniref:hypothetical protein n=1 Tax=Chitinophaga sp. LS1 TaxID=3051176 RepID=UPI002AAA7748|nr:hypothetical protein [Chitinophaga sp. LS1]WPV67541.1 hypothetical protein QQL36_02225 [Chitinophaga sp. LS1]
MYHEACVELEELLSKGFTALSEREELRLAEVSDAIEQWENMAYTMPIKPTFIDILNYLFIKAIRLD